MKRFDFPSAASIECFFEYQTNLVAASSPYQPEGTLIQRAIDLSFKNIEEVLPNQLATRTMGAYNNINNLTCESFITPIANNTFQTDSICENYNWNNNLTAIQTFVNATWYGDFYKSSFLNETGLNETQYDLLFDINNATSFGGVLAKINQDLSTHYDCIEGDFVKGNCSSDQLALKQWGQSAITLNPMYLVDEWNKVSTTMTEWGNFLIDFLP